LSKMQKITAGVFSKEIDYNKSLLCLMNGLDRGIRQNCSEITGIPTANVAALLFFQVLKTKIRQVMFYKKTLGNENKSTRNE
jgi:hypothetical protein